MNKAKKISEYSLIIATLFMLIIAFVVVVSAPFEHFGFLLVAKLFKNLAIVSIVIATILTIIHWVSLVVYLLLKTKD